MYTFSQYPLKLGKIDVNLCCALGNLHLIRRQAVGSLKGLSHEIDIKNFDKIYRT
jgi:hypothetical protein